MKVKKEQLVAFNWMEMLVGVWEAHRRGKGWVIEDKKAVMI